MKIVRRHRAEARERRIPGNRIKVDVSRLKEAVAGEQSFELVRLKIREPRIVLAVPEQGLNPELRDPLHSGQVCAETAVFRRRTAEAMKAFLGAAVELDPRFIRERESLNDLVPVELRSIGENRDFPPGSRSQLAAPQAFHQIEELGVEARFGVARESDAFDRFVRMSFKVARDLGFHF